MNRRTVWLGLVVLASQLAAGCCHQCGWWRFRPFGGAFAPGCGASCAAPTYGGPAFGGASCGAAPSCPSCFYGPSAPPPVVAAPPMAYAPGAIYAAPPVAGPVVEQAPQAMPVTPGK